METMVRKKRKPMSEINVVPYIDVMLVLLIVFMVTAPMLNQGIEVDLPQANNEPLNLNENLETLIVSITASGEYFLSIGATGEDRESLNLDTIGLRVSQIASVNLRIHAMTYKSNPSELARVLMDEGAKSLGLDLEKLL